MIVDVGDILKLSSTYFVSNIRHQRRCNLSFVQAIASTTASLRFNGDFDIDLNEAKSNLVPFSHRRLHFPIISYAPFLSRERAGHKSYTVQELTDACFNRNNMMITCNSVGEDFGRFKEQTKLVNEYISCCLLYRGDVAPTNVQTSIETIKQNKLGYINEHHGLKLNKN